MLGTGPGIGGRENPLPIPDPRSRRLPLHQDVRDADAREIVAEAAAAAHALAALLLEDADLGPAQLAVHHAGDPGIRHEWSAGQHLAAVLFDHEHLVERHFAAGLA